MRHDSLHKTILQGLLKGKRKRGRTRKDCNCTICKWSGMNQREVHDAAHNRKKMKNDKCVIVKLCPPMINKSRD